MPLVRVRNISVEAHWSVAIAILTYSSWVGSSRFFGRYPDLSDATITVMTIVTVLLFEATIVLHELGHAFRARREGVEATKITLWALGGVAWIGSRRSPGVAFRVAAAGPLVTAFLAVLFTALGWLERRIGFPDPVVGVTVLLAQAEGIVLAFNLLPIFPLDGGQILHAALWRLRGFAFAWAWAIRTGVAVALLAFAFGALASPLGILAPSRGLTVMLNGAVLMWWSTRHRPSAAPRATTRLPVVADLLEASAVRADPASETTVAQFLEDTPVSNGFGTSASTIRDRGRAVGIISRGLAGQVPPDQREATVLAEIMLRQEDAIVLKRETPIEEAFRTLQSGSRRGVVLDGRRVTAIILASDLADVLLQIKDAARA